MSNKSTITINLQIITLLLVSTISCHLQGEYVLGNQDSKINIKIVYMATKRIYFVRIVTIIILPHFISHWTILCFRDFIIMIFQRL